MDSVLFSTIGIAEDANLVETFHPIRFEFEMMNQIMHAFVFP